MRRYVSTELRYGGKSGAALRPPSLLLSSPFAAAAVCAAGDVSAMITSPSAESDLLIALASFSRSPAQPVELARSPGPRGLAIRWN